MSKIAFKVNGQLYPLSELELEITAFSKDGDNFTIDIDQEELKQLIAHLYGGEL